MNVEDVIALAERAGEAFPAWALFGPHARRTLLNRAADRMAANADEFVDTMMNETGATEGWARFNHSLGIEIIREAAALTTRIVGDVIPSDKPGCLAMSMREPVGVVLGIAPWNAPIILATRAIAVPLACGNAVILKGSEKSPRTHQLVTQVFLEAGLPKDVVNYVANRPEDAGEIVGALIDHPAVRRINFTGSTSIGRIIAMRAAERLKPVLLELGGKGPLIVLEDADLDEAVKAAAFGAFMNSGQICMSTERIIVVDAVANIFTEKLKAKVAGMAVGDPRDGNAPLGALIDRQAVDHVRALIEQALAAGATELVGGEANGVLMPAHVIDHVTPEMALFREESFGPVVGITRARNEAHAIALANDTDFGLSAAIFTRDAARGLRIARQIRSGICHINGPTVNDEPQMPFGGMGSSGHGRFGGMAGIDAFTELRWITVATQPGHYPI